MGLQDYINKLSESKKNELLGCNNKDSKHHAFAAKRVVHAGLLGDPVAQEEQQVVWLQAMESPADVAKAHTIYIHIPFCQTKCLYCGFYQQASQQEKEDQYMDHLIMEIERDSAKEQFRGNKIEAVFIGGGTPTSLSAQNASRLLQSVQSHFDLAEDCEITFEGRVNDIVEDKVSAWLSGGVNRISLGVQSFNTELRQRVGRIDTGEEVMKRLHMLKTYDVTVIVDLIYGLPGQTREIWLEDLRMLVESPVDGMDIYQLNVFPGGALEQAVKNGAVPSGADIAEQADLYAEARTFLFKQGFERLSLCHWRRNRRELSLYNTLAKTGAVVFPFGSGAGGNFAGLSFMQQRQAEAYQVAVARGDKPIMMMAHQVEKKLQRISEAIIYSLEKGFLDFKQLCQQENRLKELSLVLDRWEAHGLIQKEDEIYCLTPDGEFWYISMTQSLVECSQVIFARTTSSVQEKESDTLDALDEIIAEILPESTLDERRHMVKKIPLPVRMMLKRSSKEALKSMLNGLPANMFERMIGKAASCK